MSSGSVILHKRNSNLGVVPSSASLSAGELAINTSDGKLFTKTVNGSVVSFKNDNQESFTLDLTLSGCVPQYGHNTISQSFANVLGGYNNDVSGAASTAVNGEDNDIAGDLSFIGSGYKNKITATGDYSAILAGSNNLISHPNSFALGSNLSSHSADFTYVNSISAQNGFYGDGFHLQNVGDRYYSTSTTNQTLINKGTLVFQISTNLSYTPTQNVTIAYDLSNHMHGTVIAYDTTTGLLTADITSRTGSGTYSSWFVNVGGTPSFLGALLASNNLSDVSSSVAALSNIGGLPNSTFEKLSGNWQNTCTIVQTTSASWGSAASGTLTNELSVVATSQGLYKDGDKIPAGTSIETVLINMLKTSIPPSYTSPTLSVAYGSPSVINTYEIGSTVSQFVVTPTFNSNDSGGLIDFVYFKDSTNLGTGSTKTINSFTITGTTTLEVSAGYSQGAIKNDNLGNPYATGRIEAGAKIDTATLAVLYPYFYGKSSTLPTAASIASAIQSGLTTKILQSANNNVSITYNANGEYIWFAHVATQTEKTKWYVTSLNTGSIGSGQAINAPVTQLVTSPESYWSNVNYKIYISSGQQQTTGAFEYRNS